MKREDIKYRVGQVVKDKNSGQIKGVSFLVYIDARTAFEELDSKFPDWSFEWELLHDQNAVQGVLSVGDRVFSDVGYPNESKVKDGVATGEWIKDAVSDAVKRCAVQVGIGRFLYDAPFLYTQAVNTTEDGRFLRKLKTNKGEYSELTDIGIQEIEGRIAQWLDKSEYNLSK